jgi:1-acyl-sn-glycerol-3-phosphate acyltransferase
MKKALIRLFFKSIGWKINEASLPKVQKCVIAVGPHTSNWDFIYGRLAFSLFGIQPKILIKSDLFFPPLGWILKALGGIPVNRSKRNNITDQAAKLFEENEQMYMVFTPEGTRSYNPNWKKGFYYIAQKASVPIYVCYIDFKTKTGGFHSQFDPTGNVEEDITAIKKILSQYEGRFPEKGIR